MTFTLRDDGTKQCVCAGCTEPTLPDRPHCALCDDSPHVHHCSACERPLALSEQICPDCGASGTIHREQ